MALTASAAHPHSLLPEPPSPDHPLSQGPAGADSELAAPSEHRESQRGREAEQRSAQRRAGGGEAEQDDGGEALKLERGWRKPTYWSKSKHQKFLCALEKFKKTSPAVTIVAPG
eukprot:1252728-Rhodomonas_salina.2